MKPLSIRTKVAGFAASLTAVALLVFAAGTLANVYQEQIEAADLELRSVAAGLQELHREGDSLLDLARQQGASLEPWLTTTVFDAQGGLHRANGEMPEVVARAAVADGALRTVGEGPGAHRVLTVRFGAEALVIAHDLEEVHDISIDLLTAYAFSLPVVAGIVGLGAWWLAGRALQPLRALTTSAAAITSARLDARVPVPPTHDEVGQLAAVLNTMLARLETSFRQAERFAADASHELRTPLTIMRGEIDRALHTPGLPPAVEAQMLSLQHEAARLERICDALLLLARFDAGRVELMRAPVDLSALARDTCEDAGLLGAAQGIQIEAAIDEGVIVSGDADLLRRVLLNLADNGIKFNERGGRLRCRLQRAGDRAELTVENSGPRIPPELRAHIFERFFRGDASRLGGGHGLGLSLAREIALAHSGTLDLAPDRGDGWTTFVLTLPVASDGHGTRDLRFGPRGM